MDVVRISYDEFACRRPLTQAGSSGVTTRIDSLLGSFPCFDPSRQAHGPAPRQHHQQGGEAKPAGWRGKKIEQGRKEPSWKRTGGENAVRVRRIICSVDPATAATIDALNKVTEDNYPRMLKRILVSVRSSSSPTTICRSILQKCYEQDFFLQLYLHILTDVMEQSLDDGQADLFRRDLSRFASETMALDLEATFPRLCSTADYDGFCDRVKRKKHLVAMGRTTIGLIDRGLVTASRDEFFEHTTEAVEAFCRRKHGPVIDDAPHPVPARDYDDDHADIAIEYLKEFMMSEKERTQPRLERMHCLFVDHVQLACSLMCRFKMQAIIGFIRQEEPDRKPVANMHVAEVDLWHTTTRLRQQLRLPRQQSRAPCRR